MSRTFWPSDGGSHPPGTDPSPESDLVGRTLADGLSVLEKLGETSHGSLYRARIADSDVEVELISLRPDGSGSLWDQLFRARGINHPNIAGVKGMGGTLEGQRYVALEVLRGELLSEILDTRRVLPLEEAVDLILQAASGLEAAHEAGLVHGSLSPNSILVTRTDDYRPLVKLIHFGSGQNTIYSAPERLAGRPGDERSDIFSLGAVLHHALTGEPPGAEPGEAELIPEAARSVLSKALEPLPVHRFGTVAAFARALAAVRDESGEQGDRGRGGRRGAVAIVAGWGIVAVLGVWLLSTEQSRPEPVSGQSVTFSGAASAAQVGESVSSLPAGRDTSVSPKSGTARARTPEVSRRKSIASAAPRSVREGPRVSVPERAEAAPPRPDVAPTVEAPSPTSGPADRGLGYAPYVAAEPPDVAAAPPAPAAAPPAPAAPPPLSGSEAMRLALSDVKRLHIVASYEEVKPGLLVLVLGSGYHTSTSLEYNLRKLYAAYVDLLNYPESDPVMELWQNGKKIGEYTRDGPLMRSDYVTPP